MSTIVDRQTVVYRRQLANEWGDSATYTHADGSADQTVNIQVEPFEDRLDDQQDMRFTNVETIFGIVVGTETGDVSDVVIGDQVTVLGFVWGVVGIAMQTGTTGWARLRVQRSHRVSTGSPNANRSTPGVAPGGRFDIRGK